MITNAVTVFDLWPFLVMAKGPARQLGTDLLAVQETAADQVGRCEVVMKLSFLCPRKYGDVREMIKRSDEAMKSSHRKSYVWLRRGGRGVIGFKLEELNAKIDEYNRHPCPLMDFWEWLSFEYDDVLTGFDILWNQGNPLMSYVHIIRKKVIQNETI